MSLKKLRALFAFAIANRSLLPLPPKLPALNPVDPSTGRGIAIGRGNWTFAGSAAGGHGAAVVPTPIETCELSDANPPAWLTHVLAKPRDRPAKRRDARAPWN